MRCEDYPCCGHEAGCCPSYDEAGNQLDMVCVCGQSLPLTSRTSICEGCLTRDLDPADSEAGYDYADREADLALETSDYGYRDAGYDSELGGGCHSDYYGDGC